MVLGVLEVVFQTLLELQEKVVGVIIILQAVEQEDQELGGAAAPVAQDVHSLQAEQALPMVAEEVVVLDHQQVEELVV